MRVNWATVTKCVWVSVGLFILPLGLGTFLADPVNHYGSSDLILTMLLMSFPLGPLVLLVGGLFIDVTSLSPVFYALLWLVTFVAGYVQWFWICPALFEKSRIITLGLTPVRDPAIVVASISEQPAIVAASVKDQPALPIRARPKIRRRRMAHFDRRGRTPLERAIGHL